MTNDKFKPYVPKTYEQFVLDNKFEQNQVENKVFIDSYAAEVNAYGNLEVQKGYGPCNEPGCTHTFYLNLTIGYEGFWGANGYYFTEGSSNNIGGYTVYSIEQARDLRRRFGNGTIWVCNEVGAASNNTRRKNRQAIDALDSWINVFKSGQSVSQTVNLGR